MKRLFDIVASLTGLFLLAPVFAVAACAVLFASGRPIFFRQQRIGRNFHPFSIYKFRTMVADAPQRGGPLTTGGDSRVTRVGAVLRKLKIDELPQLVNVLKGDMSVVGPRPEVPEYVDRFQPDYEVILQIRPGITDLASLKYADEAGLLSNFENPQEAYIRQVLPDKIRLAREYLRRSSLIFDIHVILKTLLKLTHLTGSPKDLHGTEIHMSRTAR
ncbi:MAG TPA: sugar transferase [Terriglobales bacterium]|jgi:lipopolysaccharide/colanic/teichoic acid biosynthesis glycosyltransferase|nr:sugar transferase [Terriglobales bacterium]